MPATEACRVHSGLPETFQCQLQCRLCAIIARTCQLVQAIMILLVKIDTLHTLASCFGLLLSFVPDCLVVVFPASDLLRERPAGLPVVIAGCHRQHLLIDASSHQAFYSVVSNLVRMQTIPAMLCTGGIQVSLAGMVVACSACRLLS